MNSRLKFHNKTRLTILISALVVLFFTNIVIPLWFINYLSLSGIGHFFAENSSYSIISLVFLLYFLLVGEYYYRINIDPYVIQVTSYRVIFDFFREKNYVDIPHSMLYNYAFFNRPFSLNKTLMLKIVTDRGKKITKRFNITLISKKEVEKISSVLQSIIEKNR